MSPSKSTAEEKVREPVASLTYNAANRLTSVTGTPLAITGMVYDAFGQRCSKTAGGATTYFIYGQDGSLLEESNGGFPIDYVYLNTRPVAEILPSTGKMYFLHDDRLGTPQLASDGSQNVVWSASYQPFGQTTATSGSISQNLRFPGQYADAETGWNHNGFRDYVPSLGRYIASDPIGLLGGSNTYTYVGGNSITRTDKFGLLDLNLNPYGSDEYNEAATIFSIAGIYTVAGPTLTPYGLPGPTDFTTQDLSALSPYDLAFVIKSDPNYLAGEPVILIECGANRQPSKDRLSLAQALSNALNAPVWGADYDVWLNGTGGFYSLPWDVDFDNSQHGAYTWVYPMKRR